MKRFKKIILGFTAFFTILGICCIVAAFALGLDWGQLKDMAYNGELSIQKHENGVITFFEETDNHHSENHHGGSCTKMDIEVPAGSLKINYGDVDEIKVTQNGIKNFSCKIVGDTLQIRGGKHAVWNNSNRSVSITIPNGLVFKEVDLELGAGQADIHDLCADVFDIEVGAGQAVLKNVDVKHMNATTGAGQIKAELVESKEDYNYDVECGIGEILIGDNSFGGLGRSNHIENPEAERSLDVECGIGQIVIHFQK